MYDFADLLESLILAPSRNRKIDLIVDYLTRVPDPDRGFGLAALTRDLRLSNLSVSGLKSLVLSRVDETLFALSYDYVGDLAETISLIWPRSESDMLGRDLPALSQIVGALEGCSRTEAFDLVSDFLDRSPERVRWAMIKLVTGGLRAGVSARLAKVALARYADTDVTEIEKIWHGLTPPFSDLFAWLDGRGPRPYVAPSALFHPMMLAHPVDTGQVFEKEEAAAFVAEWKWDGIRVQLAIGPEQTRLYSRTGDEITRAFPDVVQDLNTARGRVQAVFDGELLVGSAQAPLPFNALQQRLNRKAALAAHLDRYPAFVRAYDLLFDGEEDVRSVPWQARRTRLEALVSGFQASRLDLSPVLPFASWQDLSAIRERGIKDPSREGVMIKRVDSPYVPGRPKGLWFKWKRDPRFVDAVIMYAQRGHGRRSSYYSDFTFGVWGEDGKLVPIGKAYSGFTDAELDRLDRFVRRNTVARFGPVREVKKDLVVEVAFDSAFESRRHKSGLALRFPRIHRIRWDKPANEVEALDAVRMALLGEAERPSP